MRTVRVAELTRVSVKHNAEMHRMMGATARPTSEQTRARQAAMQDAAAARGKKQAELVAHQVMCGG